MSNAQQASATPQASPNTSRKDGRIELPGENLTIQETLRVMDVAREMREQRQTAEDMFRHTDTRRQLREKLMRMARLAGDTVTDAEIDAAIDQYLANLHTYKDPDPGLESFLAHCWIRRSEIAVSAFALAAMVGGVMFFFF